MDHSEVKHLPKVDHAPAELDEPSRLLLKAADMIEQRGLKKGSLCDDALAKGDAQGALCFRGALNTAMSGNAICWEGWDSDGPAFEAERRMAVALGLKACIFSGDKALSIPEWNNASARTKEQVIAKMRAVALGL